MKVSSRLRIAGFLLGFDQVVDRELLIADADRIVGRDLALGEHRQELAHVALQADALLGAELVFGRHVEQRHTLATAVVAEPADQRDRLALRAALADLAVDAVGQHAVHQFPGVVVAAVERAGVVRLDHAADLRAQVLHGSARAAAAALRAAWQRGGRLAFASRVRATRTTGSSRLACRFRVRDGRFLLNSLFVNNLFLNSRLSGAEFPLVRAWSSTRFPWVRPTATSWKHAERNRRLLDGAAVVSCSTSPAR